MDDVYQVFFTEPRDKMDKKLSSFNAVSEEQDTTNTESDVAAFWPQQWQQPETIIKGPTTEEIALEVRVSSRETFYEQF